MPHSLKLTSKTHPIQCTVAALETSICCQLKIFSPLRRKDLLQHTVDNEVSLALARLPFHENLFIRFQDKKQVSVARINGLIFKGKCMDSPRGQRKLSLITRCPY